MAATKPRHDGKAGAFRPAARSDGVTRLKFLFVHQNYPGQFLHIVRHLVAMNRHEILFITEPNANEIAGVRKIPYLRPTTLGNRETHVAARELDDGVRRAEVV